MDEKNTEKRKPLWPKVTIFVLVLAGLLVLIFLDKIKSLFAPVMQSYEPEIIEERLVSETAGVPEFSKESGFYDEEFELTLKSESGEIYYTLDGTDPAFSTTAVLYEKPVKIYDNSKDRNNLSSEANITLSYYVPPRYFVDKGMIIRAAVKDSEGGFGDTVTKSFFVQKDKEYYKAMKVISLVTSPYNLFDPDNGIYVIGNGYVNWKNSSDFDPQLEDWNEKNPTNYNQSGKDWERPATIQVFEGGKLVFEQNLAIRLSGHASRSHAQKSIRLYAREEYGDKKIRYAFFDDLKDIRGKDIEKFDKLTLRNAGNDTGGAFFRDELVHSLSKDLDISVQAEEPCILFIDGEFWGMYHIREREEDSYFASHYDVDKKNVTYIKCDETEGSEDIQKEYEEFYEWAMSADLSEEGNYERVTDVIDIQSLMDYFAVQTYINNFDWLCVGRNPNNIGMWRVNEPVEDNPYGDGRWRFVLYDTEYSANLYGQDGTDPAFDSFGNISKDKKWTNPGALFFRLLINSDFKEAFYANYIKIMGDNFSSDAVNEWIDNYTGRYSEAIADTFVRFLSVDDGRSYLAYNIQTVRDFYNSRPAYARQYLEDLIN